MSLPDDLGAWGDLPFFRDHWPDVQARLAQDSREILPPEPLRFAALTATQPEAVRVVILGQDPYPTPGHANGLAFSVSEGTRLPASLKNIFKELQDDVGTSPTSGDLSNWAQQGVLLLNTALSVPAGDAGGHAKLGWRHLTEDVLRCLDSAPRAFLLWGNHAQSFETLLTHPDHLVVKSVHPSPLSARRGFFGSRPFSRVNTWLAERGDVTIDWSR